MARTCPWCREPLGWGERGAEVCPHCGKSLHEAEGRELRTIDLRYDEVEATQCQRFRQFTLYGSIAAGGVSLVLPLAHLGATVVVPLLVIVHLILLRLLLVREARGLLGTSRKVFTRWLARFSFLWLGIPGYGLAVVPLAGVLAGVGTFVGLTALVHHYTLWSLKQERDRRGLMLWEKLLVVGLAVLTAVVVAVLIGAALLLGWGVAALIELVRSSMT
jgi:hypothetical protein